MSVITITARANQLDRRFSQIFDDEYDSLPEMRPMLMNVKTARKGEDEKYAAIGEMGDLTAFDGQINFDQAFEGYNVRAVHKEFASGMKVTRTMRDYDLTGEMEEEPAKMARAANRTMENHSSRIWTMAFSNDNMFYTHSEGVPLCSNSHTTRSGASTATGFDNLGTSALSATSLEAARIQMRGYRGDRGQRINVMPNEIWIPPNLYATAYEIVSSLGKVNSANNDANVHYGQFDIREWNYMSSSADWFLCDGSARKSNVYWFNSAPVEFANTGEFETLIWKWRVYVRYSYLWRDWRWVFGADV